MTKIAKGPFEVEGKPLASEELSEQLGAMRMRFEKRFQGPLEATSRVMMMGMMNQELGSGGYVALEKITGSLDGRKGTFCMQHSCLMERGKSSQSIAVVPDSGTDELVGLSGVLAIDIDTDGNHFYTLEYSFKK